MNTVERIKEIADERSRLEMIVNNLKEELRIEREINEKNEEIIKVQKMINDALKSALNKVYNVTSHIPAIINSLEQ